MQLLTKNNELQIVLSALISAATDIRNLLRFSNNKLYNKTGTKNASGDVTVGLDMEAQKILLGAFEGCSAAHFLASEESQAAQVCSESGVFDIGFDPLDGSSIVETLGPVGTIFSIYPHASSGFLGRRGEDQVAAGYFIYSHATELIIAFKDKPNVQRYALSETGDLRLIGQVPKIPRTGRTYSVNDGNSCFWSSDVQMWSNRMRKSGTHTLRYTGSLVADAHRTLLSGGIFAYPADSKNKNGKLRLLYEAAPIALIFEKAGGRVCTDGTATMGIELQDLHQRVPLVLGSPADVDLYSSMQT